MAGDKTLKLSIWIAGHMDKSLTAAISSANGQISSLSQNMSRMGTVGLAAMGALAAGTVVALGKCTKEAESFEKSMADVVKYVDGLADKTGKISNNIWGAADGGNGRTFKQNYKEMSNALLDLSTQIPMTAEDLTKLAAAAGQSGKSMSDLIAYDSNGNIGGFLKDVAMVGTAMDITADQAGNWAAKWEKSLNMTHEQVMVLFDQINYLGANSATTAAEIAEVVNSAASLGDIAGMDAASTAALADAMLAMGVDSSVASTSISRMLVNMSKGESATKKQKEAWAELGLTASGVARAMQTDATGTMLDVLERIGNMDAARQVATLNTLFGQWAIKGAAKLTGNLSTFTDALKMVSDTALYGGSMEREFIIKASTSDAIDTMMKNSFEALKINIGTEFLPVKNEFSLMVIDTMNGLRKNMPELTALATSAAKLLSNGVASAGEALKTAMPYIQQALDYLVNNGDKVIKVIEGIGAAFLGMKFAPQIEGAARGIGTLLTGKGGMGSLFAGGAGQEKGRKLGGLLGGVKNLFTGGQSAAAAGASRWSAVVKGGQLGAMEYGGSRWNRMNGRAVGVMATLQNMSGLFSGKKKSAADASRSVFNTIFNAKQNGLTATGILKNAITNSAAGQYVSSVFDGLKDVRTARARFSGSLGAGAKTLIGSLRSRKGKGLMGTTGLMSFNDAVFGSPLSAGGAIKNILGSGGGLIKSGGSLLGNIWGPLAGGFGSLFAGAVPVVGAISGIIAVVSILGDHLEDVRGIVGNVFGEKGLVIFDTFTDKIKGVGQFISGLFQEGGVKNALAPLREMFSGALGKGGLLSTIFGGQEGGLAAFDGVVQIIQSVMGVVGQLVSFSVNTVQPIIERAFTFITQTVLPTIVTMFASAAPTIASIISGIGSAVMTGMQLIGSAIQTAMPIIEAIIQIILNIGSVAIPAVLSAFSVFAQGISALMANIKGIFDGLISFITGVFTGNWQQAWDGIKQVFGSAFDALVTLCKTPINAVISLINTAISGINSLGLDIPDWVPLIGGKKFAINIPEIPLLARGGFTTGPSIAGEAGREAVISFKSSERARNISLWEQAGRMLGVNAVKLDEIERDDQGWGAYPGGESMTFAPQIIIQGNADASVMEQAIAEMRSQFEEWYEQMQHRRMRTAY